MKNKLRSERKYLCKRTILIIIFMCRKLLIIVVVGFRKIGSELVEWHLDQEKRVPAR